ncbi:hypothetical protein ACFQZF_08805 [Flavobacterium myungsuense]|uniref:hypothetical protein n=1 Tax=Flavobacterium myungsuense TaxID=651823 RepID=UPI0036318E22
MRIFVCFLFFIIFSCDENLNNIKELEVIINVDFQNEYKIKKEESPLNFNDTYYSVTIIIPKDMIGKVLYQTRSKCDSINGVYYLNFEESGYRKSVIIYKKEYN